MKYYLSSFIVLVTLLLSYGNNCTAANPTLKMTFNASDQAIVERILNDLKEDASLGGGQLMVKVGSSLIATPYVASTLEGSNTEQLVINLRELDCTTFVENCLALARTIQHQHPSFEQFTKELLSIRYRDGHIDQYPSRLHYFSDWIFNNSKKGLVADLSEQIGNTPFNKQINFMTQHRANYVAFKNHPSFIKSIALQEATISSRMSFYIPKHQLAQIEHQLRDGDILGITTTIKGLDAAHVVIALWKDDHLHFIHASQAHHKVVISSQTLEQYLNSSKSATGIMIARPL